MISKTGIRTITPERTLNEPGQNRPVRILTSIRHQYVSIESSPQLKIRQIEYAKSIAATYVRLMPVR